MSISELAQPLAPQQTKERPPIQVEPNARNRVIPAEPKAIVMPVSETSFVVFSNTQKPPQPLPIPEGPNLNANIDSFLRGVSHQITENRRNTPAYRNRVQFERMSDY